MADIDQMAAESMKDVNDEDINDDDDDFDENDLLVCYLVFFLHDNRMEMFTGVTF